MILQVENLRSGYGRIPILNGVTLSVAAGEYLGILGHNGMGKTTLMRTIMGHLPATAGAVRFEGVDVTALPVHARSRAGVGLVPQGRQIFPDLSVRENLRMGQSAAAKEDAALTEEILALFPRLERLLDRRGGALSGGEQQLLALARCLCSRPKLILLDEPTEGIQPNILEEIVETLKSLRARGLSLVLVEQNLDFIAALSSRVLIIQKGAITGALSPADLRNPETVAEFVGMAAV
jgi:branched-chain amino acid transport system ATP-binding protein/urea transport system ATP-binding protein